MSPNKNPFSTSFLCLQHFFITPLKARRQPSLDSVQEIRQNKTKQQKHKKKRKTIAKQRNGEQCSQRRPQNEYNGALNINHDI